MKDFPRGYPQLAAYTNSEDNRHICRRFGYIRSRHVLYVQDEVQQFEKKLADLDESDRANEETAYHLNSRRWDEENSTLRKDLIATLKVKLKEYDELVLREHQMLKISAPSRKNHIRYFNYIWEEKPLCREEYDFVFHEDDMLDLAAEPESEWVGNVIDFILALLPRGILKV